MEDFTDDYILAVLRQRTELSEAQNEKLFELARNAWTWRDIDRQLGELVADSLDSASGLRSFDTHERSLRWRWPDMTMELLATESTDVLSVRTVLGQPTGNSPFNQKTVVVTQIIRGEPIRQDQQIEDSAFGFTTVSGRLLNIDISDDSTSRGTGWFRL
jgi:hypothetical protein